MVVEAGLLTPLGWKAIEGHRKGQEARRTDETAVVRPDSGFGTAVEPPHADQTGLWRRDSFVDPVAQLASGTSDVPHSKLVHRARGGAPTDIVADLHVRGGSGHRSRLIPHAGRLTVDIVAAIGSVENDGDVRPLTGRDRTAVACRARAAKVATNLSATNPQPPSLRKVFAADAHAGGSGHVDPSLDG